MRAIRVLSLVLLVATPLAHAVLGAPPAFPATPVSYAVGSGPRMIAIGDLNGDGKPDLVVPNHFADNLSILLGNGNGTFGAASTLFTMGYNGTNTCFAAIADYNRDGKNDLIVTNVNDSTGAGQLVLMPGNGTGAFTGASLSTSTTGTPTSLTVGDFNRDGKSDWVMTLASPNAIGTWLGDGSTWGGGSTAGLSYAPLALAIGDFNGDGRSDLAAACMNKVAVFLGNANGSFTGPVTYSTMQAISVAVGDFNGDGKSDLAVADWSGFVEIFPGNGNGTFGGAGTPYPVGTGPVFIVAADFNADGKADLAVANSASNDVSILTGNGDGTFAAALNFAVGTYPQWLLVSDLNGDGKRDIVVANRDSANISVMLNQCTVGFPPGDANGDTQVTAADVIYLIRQLYTSGDGPIISGNVNGDGKVDVADVFYLINYLFAGGPAPIG